MREGEAPLPLPAQPQKALAVPERGLDQAVCRAEEARQQREPLENHVVLPDKAEAVKAEQMTMEPPAEEGEKPVYRVIGTLLNTYILLEVGDSLMMIDQHAAHERLMYEKFTERMNRGEKAAQELLVPIVVDVFSPGNGIASGKPGGAGGGGVYRGALRRSQRQSALCALYLGQGGGPAGFSGDVGESGTG